MFDTSLPTSWWPRYYTTTQSDGDPVPTVLDHEADKIFPYFVLKETPAGRTAVVP